MGLYRAKKGAATIEYEPYENCPFCKHRAKPGCFGCKDRRLADEREAAKRVEDMERLEASRLGTFHFDNPEEMATLHAAFSREAIEKNYDSSDISDEDVLEWMGKGDRSSANSMIAMAATLAHQRQSERTAFGDPAYWTEPKTLEQFKELALESVRQKMAMERGYVRMVASLRGKPGAGPGTEVN